MDKRLRHIDRDRDRELRDAFYDDLRAGRLSIAQAVKTMQRLSHMTQPEFAKNRGVSVQALRQIQSGKGNPTVETLDKIAAVFGLRVGFSPIAENAPADGAVALDSTGGSRARTKARGKLAGQAQVEAGAMKTRARP